MTEIVIWSGARDLTKEESTILNLQRATLPGGRPSLSLRMTCDELCRTPCMQRF
jgi:hypothetical protein